MAWDNSSFDPETGTATLVWNTGLDDEFTYSAVIDRKDEKAADQFIVDANTAQRAAEEKFKSDKAAEDEKHISAMKIAASLLEQANA